MKKLHPYYYKLRRVEKTCRLLQTMLIFGVKPEFKNELGKMIAEIETAILCRKVPAHFYRKRDLLKED